MTKEPNQLTVGELLNALSKVDGQLPLRLACGLGIGRVSSYRGYYEDMALEPDGVGTVEQTIKAIRETEVLHGYKGGEFGVSSDTAVWIAGWGDATGVYPVGVRVVEVNGERFAVIDTAWEAYT